MPNMRKSQAKLLAFDMGAESGRAIIGNFDGSILGLEEIHRFANGPVRVGDNLFTDVLYLWEQIQTGLKIAAVKHKNELVSVGVDTWGVDYALLDKAGMLIGNPHHYRDHRTDGAMEKLFSKISREEVYFQTGNQFMRFNTLFQLFVTQQQEPYILNEANYLLMLPDLFHYWLCGEKSNEYCIATTTQCYDQINSEWANKLLNKLQIPTGIFQSIKLPGEKLGDVHSWLLQDTGCAGIPVILPASHDTGSAVTAVPVQDNSFLYISSGTWSLVGVELLIPIITTESLACNITNEGNPDRRTRFLKVVPGMWLLQQSKKEWQSIGKNYSYDQLTHLATNAPEGGSVIDVTDLEFLDPGDMTFRIRNFCSNSGQQIPETDGEVVRCILESLAFLYRSLLEDFERVLRKKIEVIHIIGGGSKNSLLNQLTADITHRTVIAGPVEATSAGNLLVQAMGMGYLSSISDIRQVVRRSFQLAQFDPIQSNKWEDAYQRYLKICM